MHPKNLKNYSLSYRIWWVIGVVMTLASWYWCGKSWQEWWLQTQEQKNHK